MSAIEDTRKVFQDFLAPELRAIAVRLDALEKRYESLDRKLDEVDRRAEKRSDSLGLKMDDILRLVEKRLDEANRLAEAPRRNDGCRSEGLRDQLDPRAFGAA